MHHLSPALATPTLPHTLPILIAFPLTFPDLNRVARLLCRFLRIARRRELFPVDTYRVREPLLLRPATIYLFIHSLRIIIIFLLDFGDLLDFVELISEYGMRRCSTIVEDQVGPGTGRNATLISDLPLQPRPCYFRNNAIGILCNRHD